jgi:hypothetical protein
VHATGRDGVEVGGEGCDEGLALPGLHLGDVAKVECRAAHELHVEVTHAEGAFGCLAHGGEGLRQQVLEGFAVGIPLAEFDGFVLQLLVTELREVVLEMVDRLGVSLQPSKGAALADTEDLFKNVGHC